MKKETQKLLIFTKVEVLGGEIPSQGSNIEPSLYTPDDADVDRKVSFQIAFKGLLFFFSSDPPLFCLVHPFCGYYSMKNQWVRRERQDCNRPITLSHAKLNQR